MNLTIDHKPTPAELAAMFLEMDNTQQAEFFTACRAIVLTEWSAHGTFGQALWIAQGMPVGSPGADFIMDLAAPWYTHTLRYVDSHGERERA